jgi:hypothetical protein
MLFDLIIYRKGSRIRRHRHQQATTVTAESKGHRFPLVSLALSALED